MYTGFQKSDFYIATELYKEVKLFIKLLILQENKVMGTSVNKYHALDINLMSCGTKRLAHILSFNRWCIH